jgi:hypothetical protein
VAAVSISGSRARPDYGGDEVRPVRGQHAAWIETGVELAQPCITTQQQDGASDEHDALT